MQQPAIHCVDLRKTFPLVDEGSAWRLLFTSLAARLESYQALQDLSFSVPKGKILGVLGRNGAGKSTMLRTVAGVYSRDGGEVTIDGRVRGIFELGIGGHKFLTGYEFARRWLLLNGIPFSEHDAVLADIESFTELGPFFRKPIRSYSTGMAARLYFGVVTAIPGEVLLIDEILSVGDAYFNAKSWRRIRARLKNGASGILATHDWAAVLKLCDQAVILDKGRIVAEGAAIDVVRTYLALEHPPARNASLVRPDLPLRAKTGENTVWSLELDAKTADPILVTASIELVSRSVGWENMLMCEGCEVARGEGRHQFEIVVPTFPLRPGRYYLNVFLTRRTPSGGQEVADVHSWTSGNPIEVLVEGFGSEDLGLVPLNVSGHLQACS